MEHCPGTKKCSRDDIASAGLPTVCCGATEEWGMNAP